MRHRATVMRREPARDLWLWGGKTGVLAAAFSRGEHANCKESLLFDSGSFAKFAYFFARLRSTVTPPNSSVRALIADDGSISGALKCVPGSEPPPLRPPEPPDPPLHEGPK